MRQPTRLMPPSPGRDAAGPSASAVSPPSTSPPSSPRAAAGEEGTPSPCACAPGGLISPRPRSLLWPRYAQLPAPRAAVCSPRQDARGGEGDRPLSLMQGGHSAPQALNPCRADQSLGQTQPCCPAPPGTRPRAPSLYQLPQPLGTTELGTTEPPARVPPGQVPLAQVPPSHWDKYHQFRHYRAGSHRVAGLRAG